MIRARFRGILYNIYIYIYSVAIIVTDKRSVSKLFKLPHQGLAVIRYELRFTASHSDLPALESLVRTKSIEVYGPGIQRIGFRVSTHTLAQGWHG